MRHNYEDIHRLVNEMRAGSLAARRELIEAHVGLAIKSAQEFEDDEALSDALMVLVEEVYAFSGSGKHPAALPAYLKTALGRAASHHRQRWIHNATHDADRFLRSGRALPSYREFEAVDAMNEILECCESEDEKRMVFYRSHGFNNTQVGLKIGYSPTFVAESIRRLELRLQVRRRHRA